MEATRRDATIPLLTRRQFAGGWRGRATRGDDADQFVAAAARAGEHPNPNPNTNTNTNTNTNPNPNLNWLGQVIRQLSKNKKRKATTASAASQFN